MALPDPHTREALWAQTQKLVSMVAKARRSNPGLDLIVFPEYCLHGLSMSTAPQIMCILDGPEVMALRQACQEHRIWG
ncbi:nitrilase-related carbon-nitrogen hydrolase, partial [Pseudomonas syringae group genomosp. 7]|uniref:nitrilase-related carbon-nitrogen hydrolase n=1 Tax=Pseudomonas syringae group genomosp. 7 TaxID=251699 RepID=UPI0037701BA0